jgi:hypothetical protein
MKGKFEKDPGFLKIGLQGIPSVDAMNTFKEMAEIARKRKEADAW